MEELNLDVILFLQKNGIAAHSLSRFHNGIMHGAYLLDTVNAGKMVLRQLVNVPDPKGSPVESVHRLHLESHRNGAPIPAILHEGLIPYQNSCLQLSEFIEGQHPTHLDTDTAFEIGRAISQFQKAATPLAHLLDIEHRESHIVTRAVNIATRGLQSPLQELQHLSSVLYRNYLFAKLDHTFRSESVPMGIIHYDITPHNILLTPDNKAVLIDLDLTRNGFLAYDLCSAIYSFGFHKGHFDYNLTQALIQGYESVRTLEPAEKIYLPDLLAYVIKYNDTAEKRMASMGQNSELNPHSHTASKIKSEFHAHSPARHAFNKMLGNVITFER